MWDPFRISNLRRFYISVFSTDSCQDDHILVACTILRGSPPTQLCIFLYSWVSLLYFLLWLTVSTSPSHSLYLLFHWVFLSILAFIYLILMVFFWAVINNNSVSLFRFPLHCHLQSNSPVISLVCLLKCPCILNIPIFFSWWFNNSCLPVCLLVIFIVAVIGCCNYSISALFLYSLSSWIAAYTQASVLVNSLLPPFLVTWFVYINSRMFRLV